MGLFDVFLQSKESALLSRSNLVAKCKIFFGHAPAANVIEVLHYYTESPKIKIGQSLEYEIVLLPQPVNQPPSSPLDVDGLVSDDLRVFRGRRRALAQGLRTGPGF